jgi:uncharacterized protein YbaR (Trm112 family)
MIDSELLAKLRCPETRLVLRVAAAAELAQLNEGIRRGGIKNRGGKAVIEAVDGALVRADDKVAYPIRNDIPLMLAEEAIPLT